MLSSPDDAVSPSKAWHMDFQSFSANLLFDNCIRVYGTLSPHQFYVQSKGTMAVTKLQNFSVTDFISTQEIMTDRQTVTG